MGVNYDPNTGEPIYTQENPNQIVGYDPNTGAPIYAGSQQNMNQEMPNQVYPNQGYPNQVYPNQGYPNAYGYQMPPQKKKFPVWIFIVIAAVVVLLIGGGVAAAFVSGAFVSPTKKILIAAGNTFQTSDLMQAMDTTSYAKDGQYSVGIGVNLDDVEIDSEDFSGVEVNMEVGADIPNGVYALNGDVYLPQIGMEISAEGYLDREELVFAVPDILNTSFVYHYSENPQGYLAEQAGYENMEMVNKLLSWYTNQNTVADQEKLVTDLKNELLGVYNTCEFKSDKGAAFEVDGQSRKCKAYSTELNKAKIVELLDAIERAYGPYMETQNELMREMMEIADPYGTYEEMDLAETMQELKDELNDDMSSKLTVYLYKKQIAAITLTDATSDYVNLEIMGGDYPLQNWRFAAKVEDEDLDFEAVKSASRNGTMESSEIVITGEEDLTIQWKYDPTDGSLGGKFYMDEGGVEFDGSIAKSDTEMKIAFDRIDVDTMTDDMSLSGYLTISDDAKLERPSYEEFDIGTATEDDMIGFVMSHYGDLSGLLQ